MHFIRPETGWLCDSIAQLMQYIILLTVNLKVFLAVFYMN